MHPGDEGPLQVVLHKSVTESYPEKGRQYHRIDHAMERQALVVAQPREARALDNPSSIQRLQKPMINAQYKQGDG